MMKKSKLVSTLAIMALIGVLGAAGVALAEPGDGDRADRGRGGFYGLTDEEQAEMRQIHEDFYKKVAPLRRQMMSKQAELDAFYYSGSTDEGKAQSLHREIADIQAKMFSARTALRSQLEAKGIYEQGWGGRGGWGDNGMMRGGCGAWGGGRGGCGFGGGRGMGWHDGGGRGWHDGDRGGWGGRHR